MLTHCLKTQKDQPDNHRPIKPDVAGKNAEIDADEDSHDNDKNTKINLIRRRGSQNR